MSMIKKIATAGAVATIGLGLGAASASAYSISGGSYTSTSSSTHRFTVGGTYTITCSGAVFSGSATGSDTTHFTPAYTGCSFYGFPANVVQAGTWNIQVTGDDGLPTPTWYYGTVNIPSGTKTTINVPITGCKVEINGAQSFSNGVGGNVGRAMNFASGVGVGLEAKVNNVTYTATSCPFSSGTNGLYDTGNAGTGSATPTNISGITVS